MGIGHTRTEQKEQLQIKYIIDSSENNMLGINQLSRWLITETLTIVATSAVSLVI